MPSCMIHPDEWNPILDETQQCGAPANKHVSFRWHGQQYMIWMCDFHYGHWRMQSYFEDYEFFENVVW